MTLAPLVLASLLAQAGPAATGAPITARGASAPRTLEERFAEVVNVRDFGARADGQDDAPAIQAAIDHAVRSGVRSVFVPPGTYVLGASLNLQGIWGLRIAGGGVGWYNVTRLLSRHPGRPVFDAVGANMLTFEDLVVVGSDGPAAPACAFLFSRDGTSSGAGMHELRRVWTNGHFSKAAVVSLSSEANKYDRCVLANSHPGGHAFWTDSGNASPAVVSDFQPAPDRQDGGNTMFEFFATHFSALGGGTSAAVKGGLVNASFLGCYTNSTGFATFDLDGISDSALIGWRDESTSRFGLRLGSPTMSSRNVTILGSKASRGIYAVDGHVLSHWTVASTNLNWAPRPDPPGAWVVNVDRLQYSWLAVSNGIRVRSSSRANAFPAAGAGMTGGAQLALPADSRGDTWTTESAVPGYAGAVAATRWSDTPGTHLFAPRVEAAKFKTRVQKLSARALGGALRPDQANGSVLSVLLDGPLHVHAPAYMPGAGNDADDGARVTFIFTQDGAGGHAVTWDRAAWLPAGFSAPTGPGRTSVVTFVADPTTVKWVAESHEP